MLAFFIYFIFSDKLYQISVHRSRFSFIQKHVTDNKELIGEASQRMANVLEKQNPKKVLIVKTLKCQLECNNWEASEIYYNYLNEINDLDLAKEAIEYLLKNGISHKVMKQNSFLLSMKISKAHTPF